MAASLREVPRRAHVCDAPQAWVCPFIVSPECGKEKGVEAAEREKKNQNSHNCLQRSVYHPSGVAVAAAQSTQEPPVTWYKQLGLRKDLPGQKL